MRWWALSIALIIVVIELSKKKLMKKHKNRLYWTMGYGCSETIKAKLFLSEPCTEITSLWLLSYFWSKDAIEPRTRGSWWWCWHPIKIYSMNYLVLVFSLKMHLLHNFIWNIKSNVKVKLNPGDVVLKAFHNTKYNRYARNEATVINQWPVVIWENPLLMTS